MPSLLSNTGSSISFGFNRVNKKMYMTEAKASQVAGDQPVGGYTDFKVLDLAKTERNGTIHNLCAHWSVIKCPNCMVLGG